MPMMVTCKACKTRDTHDKFKDGCPNEECIMGRRRGRGGSIPAHIDAPIRHHRHCLCERCLEADTKTLERQLESAWEKHNAEAGIALPAIRVTSKDSPVIGPYEDRNTDEARFVQCPMTIVTYITPKGKRRK